MADSKKVSIFAAVLVCAAIHACTPDFAQLTSGTSGTSNAPGSTAGLGSSAGGGVDAAGAFGQGGSTPAGSGGISGGFLGGALNMGGDLAGGTGPNGGSPSTAGSGSGGIDGVAGMDDGGSAGAPVSDPPCPAAGKAIQMTGANVTSVPRLIQDDFTIEAWLQTTTSPMQTYFWQGAALVWADFPNNSANDFALVILNGKLVLNIGNPDTATTSTSIITTGKWVHIAVAREKLSGTVRLFINGLLESTNTNNVGSLDAVPTIRLGSAESPTAPFIGRMDELRFWSVFRSQTEIQATMHQVLVGNEPGLVAYYRFDKSGSTLVDSSPSAKDGTVAGTVGWVTSDAPLCDSIPGAAGNSSVP